MFARRRACSLGLPVLLVAAVLGPFAAPASASGEVTIRGVARVIHSDEFRGDRPRLAANWVVDTGAGMVDIDLPADAPVASGDQVRVRGTFDGEQIIPAAGGITNEGASMVAQAGPTGTRKIAVLLINFANDQSEPFTAESVEARMFGEGASVKNFYDRSSDGALALEGEVFDWYTIPHTDAYCSISQWAYDATNNPEYDQYAFDYTMFVYPQKNDCPFAGAGMMPGPWTWINGEPTLQVVGHELGHNFGVHHANGLLCDDGEGNKVMLSASCTSMEYGDPFSIMGSGANLHHNLHRTALGFLDDTQTITETGDYTLAPSADADTGAPRTLRVSRGDGTYFWLEYRQNSLPFDEWHPILPATHGVLIRIAPEANVLVQSQLIDCLPGTNWWWADAPCTEGITFEDSFSGVTIETISTSADSAVVHVTVVPDTQPPTLPSNFRVTATALTSVSLAWNASTDNRVVAGYRVYRDNVLIKTQGGTTFTDTKRKPGTTYAYTVVAFDAVGNATAKTAVKNGVTKADKTAPSIPSGVKAKRVTGGVTITWNASTDNYSAVSYRVYRNGVAIKALAGRSFTDKPKRGTFTYTVAAFDLAGNTSNRGTAPTVKVP